MSGALSYYSGLAAEQQVARRYEDAGQPISEHRWRGRYGGEIDLCFFDIESVAFGFVDVVGGLLQ